MQVEIFSLLMLQTCVYIMTYDVTHPLSVRDEKIEGASDVITANYPS